MTQSRNQPVCGICHATLTDYKPEFGQLHRVTSDCAPFRTGGQIAQCSACGAAQKPNTQQWQDECAEIYAAYDNYSLTSGVEQSVRGGPSGEHYGPRSNLVFQAYKQSVQVPETGRLLDYGCGKGPAARAAATEFPGWTIDGYDLDRRAENDLRQIPGFGELYTGDTSAIPGAYDLIVMMHALEHIPDGSRTLQALGALLKPGGHILIQVPNRIHNPFDLLVADHTIHFDCHSLHDIVQRSGLSPVQLSENWVTKELSAVAGAGAAVAAPPPVNTPLAGQVNWLSSVARAAREAARTRPFGIFGTSIVGTWLASEIGSPPDFYIDEDEAKQGLKIDGRRYCSRTTRLQAQLYYSPWRRRLHGASLPALHTLTCGSSPFRTTSRDQFLKRLEIVPAAGEMVFRRSKAFLGNQSKIQAEADFVRPVFRCAMNERPGENDDFARKHAKRFRIAQVHA